MRIGASMFLITLGAILAFALRAEPQGIDMTVVGLILMLVGAAGLIANHFVWERRKEEAQLAPPMEVHFDGVFPSAGAHVEPRRSAIDTRDPSVYE